MVEQAPDEMAWFSLANAYRDAERHDDAVRAFAKATEFNVSMSRAYQLQAQSLMALNRNDQAAEVLAKGYVIAAEKGDVMPQKAMGSLLEKLGRPVPVIEAKEAAVLGADQVIDRKTGQPGTKMADPPMRGALGKFIYENYSQETWRAWIGMGTKVINELRLDFSNPAHQKVYDQHMMEWLGINEEDIKQ